MGFLCQLLHLLEVIIDYADSKSSSPNESGVSAAEQTSELQIATPDAEINTGSSVKTSGSDIPSLKPDGSSKPSALSANADCNTQAVVDSLPQEELRLLCSLLAREGYAAKCSLLLIICCYI